MPLSESVKMICDTLNGMQFENVYLVVNDGDRATEAASIARGVFGSVAIERSKEPEAEHFWPNEI